MWWSRAATTKLMIVEITQAKQIKVAGQSEAQNLIKFTSFELLTIVGQTSGWHRVPASFWLIANSFLRSHEFEIGAQIAPKYPTKMLIVHRAQMLIMY